MPAWPAAARRSTSACATASSRAYGTDLSDVRVHTGGEAAGAAAALDARAYTVGGDIVFNQGEYSPGTEPASR